MACNKLTFNQNFVIWIFTDNKSENSLYEKLSNFSNIVTGKYGKSQYQKYAEMNRRQ